VLRAGDPRLFCRRGARWLPLPPVPAAGVSAGSLAAVSDRLWLAVPGDALWEWNGHVWRRHSMPAGLAEAVASLAPSERGLLVGTWSRGAWRGDLTASPARWSPVGGAGELPAGNLQAVAEWGGALWLATFQEGPWSSDGRRWRHLGKQEGLSSDAPRALAAL